MREIRRYKKYFRLMYPLYAALTVLLLICTTVLYAAAETEAELPDDRVYTETPVFLSQGDRGASVSTLQKRLRALGYDPGDREGIYTLATARAVMAYEADHGLYTDGVCSAAVMAAMDYDCRQAEHGTAPAYDRAALLTALVQHGTPAAGEDAQSVRNALILFQRTHGLTGTGRADTATVMALGLTAPPAPDETENAYRDLCIAMLTEVLAHHRAETGNADLWSLSAHARTLLSRVDGEGKSASLSAVCFDDMYNDTHHSENHMCNDTQSKGMEDPVLRRTAETVLGEWAYVKP